MKPSYENIDPSLLRVSEVIPEKYEPVFSFSHFNKVQSECFHELFET